MNEYTSQVANEENPKAAMLRMFATIFDLPRRYETGGTLYPPTLACREATKCLRIVADAVDCNHPYLPPSWRR